MKHIFYATLASTLALSAGSASAATVIFTENFTGANNNTVGSGWTELESGNGDVARNNNTLRLRDNLGGIPDAAAASSVIDATGYENITVTFDWRSLGPNEADDLLQLSYGLAPAPSLAQQSLWTQVFSDGDAGTSVTTQTVSLGASADNDMFNLMFWTSVSNNNQGNNEGFRIDNIIVMADVIVPVPVPAGAPLLLAGLGGLALLRRKN